MEELRTTNKHVEGSLTSGGNDAHLSAQYSGTCGRRTDLVTSGVCIWKLCRDSFSDLDWQDSSIGKDARYQD